MRKNSSGTCNVKWRCVMKVCSKAYWKPCQASVNHLRWISLFEHVLDVTLLFLLLILTYFSPFSIVSIVDFKQVNVSWGILCSPSWFIVFSWTFECLTHFSPVSHFYTPWKGFLTFSGGIEMWHWTKMG